MLYMEINFLFLLKTFLMFKRVDRKFEKAFGLPNKSRDQMKRLFQQDQQNAVWRNVLFTFLDFSFLKLSSVPKNPKWALIRLSTLFWFFQAKVASANQRYHRRLHCHYKNSVT